MPFMQHFNPWMMRVQITDVRDVNVSEAEMHKKEKRCKNPDCIFMTMMSEWMLLFYILNM